MATISNKIKIFYIYSENKKSSFMTANQNKRSTKHLYNNTFFYCESFSVCLNDLFNT